MMKMSRILGLALSLTLSAAALASPSQSQLSTKPSAKSSGKPDSASAKSSPAQFPLMLQMESSRFREKIYAWDIGAFAVDIDGVYSSQDSGYVKNQAASDIIADYKADPNSFTPLLMYLSNLQEVTVPFNKLQGREYKTFLLAGGERIPVKNTTIRLCRNGAQPVYLQPYDSNCLVAEGVIFNSVLLENINPASNTYGEVVPLSQAEVPKRGNSLILRISNSDLRPLNLFELLGEKYSAVGAQLPQWFPYPDVYKRSPAIWSSLSAPDLALVKQRLEAQGPKMQPLSADQVRMNVARVNLVKVQRIAKLPLRSTECVVAGDERTSRSFVKTSAAPDDRVFCDGIDEYFVTFGDIQQAGFKPEAFQTRNEPNSSRSTLYFRAVK